MYLLFTVKNGIVIIYCSYSNIVLINNSSILLNHIANDKLFLKEKI